MTDKDADVVDVDTAGDALRIVCPSCGSNLAAYETFCSKCMAPMSGVSNLDPMQAIQSEGVILSKAASSRPKPIVLIGVWVMFLPALVAGLFLSIGVAREAGGTGSSGFIPFWIGIAVAAFSITLLFKVTRNYLKPVEPPKK